MILIARAASQNNEVATRMTANAQVSLIKLNSDAYLYCSLTPKKALVNFMLPS